MRTTDVVVIGSGFGGLAAAKQLAKSNIATTVISANGQHLFQPLLYQVATGITEGANIAPAIAEVLARHKSVDVVTGFVSAVDAERKVVTYTTTEGVDQIGYTYLIVAAGAAQAYFGHDEWAERTFALKTLDDAERLRAQIHHAVTTPVDASAPGAKTFVVVGAGATGVEVAGQIAQLAEQQRAAGVAVYLVEGAGEVLPVYGGKLSAFSRRTLQESGVTVLTECFVTAIDNGLVTVKAADGSQQEIPAATVVWSAGVQANPLAGIVAAAAGAEVDRAGRLLINRDLTVGGRADIFAIGDMTSLNKLPGQSPVAMQQGRHAADIIRGTRAPGAHFQYLDKGSMAMVNTANAVVDTPVKLQLTGFLAWVAWLGLHLFYLVGLGNRAAVAWDWVRAFVGRSRPGFAGLIKRDQGTAVSADNAHADVERNLTHRENV